MGKFFDKFPKIRYDIDGKILTKYQITTNIFFRTRIIRSVLSNISIYYEHLVSDGDTPEILAEKVYGDPEAHWIILMANDIIDVQYDWPLGYDAFNKYIIKKYGSIENAKTTYHHYEKVITRTNEFYGTVDETRLYIDETEQHEVDLDVPYDAYDTLAAEQSVVNIDVGNGTTVVEITKREAITNYDYEIELNESKRPIKIIKPEYYLQIVQELDILTKYNDTISYIRRF